MSRKNKKMKELVFWVTRLYLPITLLFLIPFLISYLVGGTLTVKEVKQLTNKNFFTRAMFEIAPNNKFATYATIWILVFIVLLTVVRKLKASEVFNDSQAVYLPNCYKRLWLASKVLGYKKMQLIGVSLPMQFDVIMNGTFPEFIAENSITQYEYFDGDIDIKMMNNKQSSKILNVLICDTFDISLGNIESKFSGYPTLKISSSLTHTKLRYNNPKLVRSVRKEMQKIDTKYDELNLFLTTNPLNSLKIIGGSFIALDRSGFKKITVVQMNEKYVYDNPFVIFESK